MGGHWLYDSEEEALASLVIGVPQDESKNNRFLGFLFW